MEREAKERGLFEIIQCCQENAQQLKRLAASLCIAYGLMAGDDYIDEPEEVSFIPDDWAPDVRQDLPEDDRMVLTRVRHKNGWFLWQLDSYDGKKWEEASVWGHQVMCWWHLPSLPVKFEKQGG